jgi:hypothetical protein
MSIKRTIITTIVALALVAVVAPGVAQGVTIDELMAQISLLQSQLLTLQGGTTPTAGTGACAGVTFTRNLTVGSTGSDVKCLQVILNGNASTKVAVTGAGSPGAETTYFGAKTLAAVKVYQVANGFTPANQVGPLTRAKLNAALGGVVTPGNPPVVVPTGAGLSVMLASDNPATGTLVSGTNIATVPSQGGADLAHFTFVNGDNAAVKVTNLKVTRTGVAADATLANVYLYNGAVRLTDAASVSSGLITFNDPTGLFTVPAGSSVTIRVLADLALNASGQTAGVKVNASTDVTSNSSSVKGYFPVSGNIHSIASATLAAVDFLAANPTPASGTIDPQNDYVVWQNSLNVGTRAVSFKGIAFYQSGSAAVSDIQNYRLNVDGVNVGSAVAQADARGYITFDLSSSPVTLQTGTRVVKLIADIIGGSSRTFTYAVRVSADANFVDSQIGVGIIPTYGSGTLFTQRKSCSTTACEISSGTVTITKTTDSPSSTVVLGSSNVTIAKYTVKAAGEAVKINSLNVGIVVSTGAVANVRNVALYANGVQIGTTQTVTEGDIVTGTPYTLGSSLIVTPGSPVTLEIKADIKEYSGTAIADADTIYATIIKGVANAEAQVSRSTVATPSANVSGSTLTVGVGGLTLSRYTAYTAQNAVLPVSNYKLGHFTLSGNTTEAVNINTIEVGLNSVSGATNNLYVKFGANTTSTKATVGVSNTWSVNYSLAAGQTVDVMVYGDVGTNASTAITGLYIAGITANSGASKTAGTTPQAGGTAIVGQTITFTTGTPTTALDGSTPLAQAVAGGQSVVAGKFKLTAQNDSYTIKQVKFSVAGTADTSAVVNSLTLKDGSTVLETAYYDGANDVWDIAGLNVLVPANTTKVLTAEYNLAVPSTNGTTITTGKAATLTMSYMKVANSQGTESIPATNKTANYTYAYKTVPTFTNVTVSGQGGNLISGSPVSLMTFKVAADAKGPVSLKQIRFNVNITDGGTGSAPTMNTFSFFRGSTNLTTSSVAIIGKVGSVVTSLEGTATSLLETNLSDVFVVFDTEEVIPAGAEYTYTLKGTPSGFIESTNAAGPDTVVCSIDQDTVPADGSASGGSVGANQTAFYLDATATTGVVQTLATTKAAAGTGTGSTANGNVIWSDNSAVLHDYTYTASSADWFNGYLVNNLPLQGNAISSTN